MEKETNSLKLLIRTRLDMEDEFASGRKKRSFLWGKVQEEMRKVCPEFEMTREQLSRKFLNLVTTYKRIKQRINSTGRNATTWEFFEDFEEVYGARHSISPPVENLQSSLELTLEYESSQTQSSISAEDQEQQTCSRPVKRQKLTNSDSVLDFLREESKKEQCRHEEVMNLEREKLNLDKQRVQSLIEIKGLLQQFLNK